jgi:hypothetical protein
LAIAVGAIANRLLLSESMGGAFRKESNLVSEPDVDRRTAHTPIE